jgi:hypothetical protein
VLEGLVEVELHLVVPMHAVIEMRFIINSNFALFTVKGLNQDYALYCVGTQMGPDLLQAQPHVLFLLL